MREIIAAWACCGLLALGAAVVETAIELDAPSGRGYGGIRIPGAGPIRTHSFRTGDDADDAADESIEVQPLRDPPLLCMADEEVSPAGAAPSGSSVRPAC